MKTILVPVDFTVSSKNALLYALYLNQKIGAQIVLFHAFNVPTYATDIPVEIPGQNLKEDVINELNDWKNDCEMHYPGMKIITHLSEGLTKAEIIKEEIAIKADLLVLGTHNDHGFISIFNSVTNDVVRRSDCPVLVIPPETTLQKIERIVFATNYAEDDFENIYATLNLARMFDATVTLLHITDAGRSRTLQYNELEMYTGHFRREFGFPSLAFKLLDAGDLADGINHFLMENNIDLLCVSMRRMSAFKRIFDSSLTKKMIYYTHVPLLAFHTEY
jgi:nucleotide-binding universal stress UspA family protein